MGEEGCHVLEVLLRQGIHVSNDKGQLVLEVLAQS